MADDVRWVETTDAVDGHGGRSFDVAGDHRDVHVAGRGRAQAPENGGRVVAEQRAVTAGQGRRHRPCQPRLHGADEVDTAVVPAQPPSCDAIANHIRTEPDGEKLRVTDDAVLAPRDRERGPLNTHEVTVGRPHGSPCHKPAQEPDGMTRRRPAGGGVEKPGQEPGWMPRPRLRPASVEKAGFHPDNPPSPAAVAGSFSRLGTEPYRGRREATQRRAAAGGARRPSTRRCPPSTRRTGSRRPPSCASGA